MHGDWKEDSDGQVGRRMDFRLGQIQPRRSRAKRRQFSVRASTPPVSREKRPRYHLRCSRSVASAAIGIKPTSPSVTAASSANAVRRRMSALGQKQTYAVQKDMSALHPKATEIADMPVRMTYVCFTLSLKRTWSSKISSGRGKTKIPSRSNSATGLDFRRPCRGSMVDAVIVGVVGQFRELPFWSGVRL